MMLVRRGRSTTAAVLSTEHGLGNMLNSDLSSSGPNTSGSNSNSGGGVIFSPTPVLRRFHSDNVSLEVDTNNTNTNNSNNSNSETTKQLKSPIGSGGSTLLHTRGDIHYPGQQHHPVLLEQLMHDTHNDADGVTHSSKSNSHSRQASCKANSNGSNGSNGFDCK